MVITGQRMTNKNSSNMIKRVARGLRARSGGVARMISLKYNTALTVKSLGPLGGLARVQTSIPKDQN